jgi:alpha-D-xyloside xylohydrolase
MSVSFLSQTESSVLFTCDGTLLALEVVSDAIVRVKCTAGGHFSPQASYMIVRRDRPLPEWRLDTEDDGYILATKKVRISIDAATGRMIFMDSQGHHLLSEGTTGARALEEKEVCVSVFDDTTQIETEHSVDGVIERAKEVATRVDRTAYSGTLRFAFDDSEALYGFGSHEEGIFNYRGKRQLLYQHNMKVVIPMMLSTNGYGVLFDAYCPMVFDDTGDEARIEFRTISELDYYFMYGPEFDDIVLSYRDLTGAAPMLPRWAFGYAQSKERYKTQAELLEVVREYRERGIPLDLIILDWRSWVGELWGQKSLDPERFPDPDTMTEELHALGARLMVSIWPHMRNNGSNQVEMLEKEMLLGNRSTYDAHNPSARELYWKHANDGLFSHGIDSWWCDCTEPFEADWRGATLPETEARMAINIAEQEKYLDPEFVSVYSLLHSAGIYEGQRKATDEKRVVNLTRSGYAGQQRYSTITWSGDICAKWEVLRTQVAEGLNFCASGLPYWTTDIGGFFVDKKEQWFWDGDYPEGNSDEGYRELYVRWFQYGAFLPMFRSHGTDTPKEVWRFGEPGSATYDTLVLFDRLRYRLLPYTYSQAWAVHNGGTLVRMLPFDFRDDPVAYGVANQFMFGPALMACPVTSPMYYGSGSTRLNGVTKTRSVYLPKGSDWYDFWTGERFQGGQRIEADARLETMPVYVRAGSIIPMGPVVNHTGEGLDQPLEIRVYPGSDASFLLYEDAGDGYGYERGEYATTSMDWKEASRQLEIGERSGSYPGMGPNRLSGVSNLVVVEPGRGTGLG